MWYLIKWTKWFMQRRVVVVSLSRAEQSLKARPYLRCAECTAFGLLSKFSKRSLARLFVTCMCLSVCPCVCISVYFVACHEQHHLYRAEIVKIIIIEEKNTTLTHTHTQTSLNVFISKMTTQYLSSVNK